MEREEYIKDRIDRLTQFWAGIAGILGALVILALSLMDYYFIPDRFSEFFIYRVTCASLMGICYFFNKLKINKFYQYSLVLTCTLLPSIMIELMILSTGGHASPYYVGMILTIIFVLGFIPLSINMAILTIAVVNTIYFFPTFLFDDSIYAPLFITNLAFIFSSSGIALAWRYMNQNNLINSFSLEYNLEQDKKKLADYSENLELLVDKRTKELNRSELMFRSLFENANDGIFIMDRDGIIINLNEKACEIHGFDREALLGTNISLIETEENRNLMKERMELILAGESMLFETQHYRKDGSRVSLEISASALEVEGNILIQSFHRDITDKKKLEHQLLHAQKMESIGQLAGGIAHDFNNILTAILGFAELVLMRDSIDEYTLHKVRNIESAARRATQMVTKLLSFARRSSFEPLPFNVNSVIQDTLEMMQRLIPKGIVLEKHFSERIPVVAGDPNQLEQVIMNLILNARDAIKEKGKLTVVTSVVELESRDLDIGTDVEKGSYVNIKISDTGIGISREHLSHVFEPFYTTKEKGKGTGLGLAMVYGIVKEHKGYITVDSTLNVGTTFNIYLPVSRTVVPKPKMDVLPAVLNDITVLAIDDELHVLDFIKETLEQKGFNVLTSNNPLKGVNLYKENLHKIDVIITDIVMPEMDGTHLISSIRNVDPHAKIIAITGFSEDIGTSKIDGFLKKPFSGAKLLSTISSIMEHT